jgi:cytochrome P450
VAHGFFKRFEPDSLIYAWFTLAQVGITAFTLGCHLPLARVAGLTAASLAVFNATLLSSIIVYRLSPWHPLARFPGPAAAKITKLYMWREAKRGMTGYTQARLHKEYNSDVVRIGPNWVSLRSAAAIPIIYGGNKASGRRPWTKGDWYEGSLRGAKRISLHQEVDIDKHAQRRKLWDLGFSGKALADYKSEILTFCDKLSHNVATAAANGAPIDMALQSHCFSFDVMGVLGFGAPFDMLETSKKHFFVETLEQAMQARIPFHEVSWIQLLLHTVVPVPKRLEVFQQQNKERFEKRLKQGSSRLDLFTYLLGEDDPHSFKLTDIELVADAGLIVVAGSDTTSSLLTWFWYYNVSNPAEYTKLRHELDALQPEELSDPAVLTKLPYLNAAINETMRMQPAVPGGLRRLVPDEGVMLEGNFFPGGTTISVPGYAIQHDTRWWGADCDSYRPERWLNKEEGHNKMAYLPFSYGSRACPGKALALLEARLAIAALATKYDFSFALGFRQQVFEDGVRDHFTIQSKALMLVPTART